MKILFSPSEEKNRDFGLRAKQGVHKDTDSLAHVHSYLAFLQSASEGEIATLFGSKKIGLDELALVQNLLYAPCIESVRLYNGIGYKALDFESLSSYAQTYILNHLYIFSNLFGMVRADTLLPYYNLHQGKGKGDFTLKSIYARQKDFIDETLRDCEVLDLRAEAYCKVYECKNARLLVRVEFLKNGKKVSHYAKYYRGIYARVVAQNAPISLSKLEDLPINGLRLIEKKCIHHTSVLTYEVQED